MKGVDEGRVIPYEVNGRKSVALDYTKGEPEKRCSKCKAEKPLSDYYQRSLSPDGHQPHCKECASAYGIAYGRTARVKKRRREYYLKNRGAGKVRRKPAKQVKNVFLQVSVLTRLNQIEARIARLERLLGV